MKLSENDKMLIRKGRLEVLVREARGTMPTADYLAYISNALGYRDGYKDALLGRD